MAATLAPVMGFNGKLYYNTGTYAAPTWSIINNVGDIKVTDEADESEMGLRSGAGFSYFFAGLRKLSWEWDSIYDLADTAIAALKTNYAARTPTEFLFADQAVATSGATGIRATCQIFKFPRVEELNKPMIYQIAVKPTYSANAPSVFTTT